MQAPVRTSLAGKISADPAAGVVIGATGRPVGRVKKHGYVELWNGERHVLAHRVVWEFVHGAIPAGMQINHKNGVKTDNRIQNLELVTPSENHIHAHRLGLKRSLQGEERGSAKLTDAAVREIRASPLKNRELAEKFGVDPSIVSEVKARKRWHHVKD